MSLGSSLHVHVFCPVHVLVQSTLSENPSSSMVNICLSDVEQVVVGQQGVHDVTANETLPVFADAVVPLLIL